MTSQRQKQRAKRIAAHWQARADQAGDDPIERAAVAWDRVRAEINRQPRRHQDQTWRHLETLLTDLALDLASITRGDVAGRKFPGDRGHVKRPTGRRAPARATLTHPAVNGK